MTDLLRDRTVRLAVVLLLAATAAVAQNFIPTGDPETDKRNWLLPITENALPPQTVLSGVLWPTLVQVSIFNEGYAFGPVEITAGSEPGHGSGALSHGTGFKVDLEIVNRLTGDPFFDNLSNYIKNVAPLSANRFDAPPGANICNTAASTVSPIAPLQIAPPTVYGFASVVFALEYPNYSALGPGLPPSGWIKACTHWDVLSSYGGINITPTTVTVKVGDYLPVVPHATDVSQNEIPTQTWMFDYYFPADPSQTIAAIDSTGSITGTAGNVIGVSVGTSVLLVSEGPYFGFVDITVDPPDPPGGGPVCPVGASTGCWSWQGNSWNWNPPISAPSNPYPPSPPPPPFGVCPPGPMTVLVPCWQWNPTANNGGGAWIFVPPGTTTTGTTTTPPITPVGSIDPNDISGPPGVGSPMYIAATSPAPYTIFFENEPTATAPAQEVVVTNQIDTTRFDLTSVVLGPITFPGIPGVAAPPVPLLTLNGFSTQVDLRPGTNLLVNVSVSLTPAGLLTWTFQSLDPTTGQPPTDPTVGFLPPGGDGSVSFTARVIPSLTTGTLISDQAVVVFDANPAISTPVWSNTIDNTPPTSQVSSLPPFSILSAFPVQWSGTDVGSGIQDFTVYVSDDGAPFTVFQAHTSATTATFTGQSGHTYSFYSIARDLVGNVESAKTAAEATTQTGLAFATLTAHAEISKGSHPGFELSGNLTLGPGSAGVAPDAQPVTVAFGSFSATIPAGSFRKNKNGHYSFEGSINGVHVEFSIAAAGGSSFTFHVEADGANLSGTSNPIPLELLIGTSGGTTLVTAETD